MFSLYFLDLRKLSFDIRELRQPTFLELNLPKIRKFQFLDKLPPIYQQYYVPKLGWAKQDHWGLGADS